MDNLRIIYEDPMMKILLRLAATPFHTCTINLECSVGWSVAHHSKTANTTAAKLSQGTCGAPPTVVVRPALNSCWEISGADTATSWFRRESVTVVIAGRANTACPL